MKVYILVEQNFGSPPNIDIFKDENKAKQILENIRSKYNTIVYIEQKEIIE